MSLFKHFLMYELCFPGAITGEAEVNCPHCGELLTVRVHDPMGEEAYVCCQCTRTFEVDWGQGQVRYQDGDAEVNCPYCEELLTVGVNDPSGEEAYECCECAGTFEVDWGQGQVRYQAD